MKKKEKIFLNDGMYHKDMTEAYMSMKMTGNDYKCAAKYRQFICAKIHMCLIITYINLQKLHHHWYTLQSVFITSPERIHILF